MTPKLVDNPGSSAVRPYTFGYKHARRSHSQASPPDDCNESLCEDVKERSIVRQPPASEYLG
jgi:hypothetical protein